MFNPKPVNLQTEWLKFRGSKRKNALKSPTHALPHVEFQPKLELKLNSIENVHK